MNFIINKEVMKQITRFLCLQDVEQNKMPTKNERHHDTSRKKKNRNMSRLSDWKCIRNEKGYPVQNNAEYSLQDKSQELVEDL